MNKINKDVLKWGLYFAIWGATTRWDYQGSPVWSAVGCTLSFVLLIICLDFLVTFMVTFMANSNKSDKLTDLLDRLLAIKEKEELLKKRASKTRQKHKIK